MTKRRFAAALAAAILALSACGGGTAPPPTEAPATDAPATEESSNRYPGSGYVDKARGVSSDVDAYHDSLNDLP